MNSEATSGKSEEAVVSPKQPSQLHRRDWYPYYAGFTESFVASVIEKEMTGVDSIIDPWNGAGTTTATCEKRGLPSTGVDINPALTIIARARLLPQSMSRDIRELASEVIEDSMSKTIRAAADDDVLLRWIQPLGVSKIRALQQAIHRASDQKIPSDIHQIPELVDELPQSVCFLYCALFALVKDLLIPYRTSNPMWIKRSSTYRHRRRPSWETLSIAFVENIEHLSSRLTLSTDSLAKSKASLVTGDATKLPFRDHEFGGAVTSPPYATRIDYIQGMLPELSVLGANASQLRGLRRKATGTPVTRDYNPENLSLLDSKCGRATLHAVGIHTSKGSRSYYLPWLMKYFQDLQAGISELARTVAGKGTICIVVQDSFYKEYRIDLQTIVIELMAASGRTLKNRSDFRVQTPRSKLVSGSGETLIRQSTETLLVFQ